MPAQLLSRLNRFPDSHQATTINALENVPRVDFMGPPPVQNEAQPDKPASNTRPREGDDAALDCKGANS